VYGSQKYGDPICAASDPVSSVGKLVCDDDVDRGDAQVRGCTGGRQYLVSLSRRHARRSGGREAGSERERYSRLGETRYQSQFVLECAQAIVVDDVGSVAGASVCFSRFVAVPIVGEPVAPPTTRLEKTFFDSYSHLDDTSDHLHQHRHHIRPRHLLSYVLFFFPNKSLSNDAAKGEPREMMIPT